MSNQESPSLDTQELSIEQLDMHPVPYIDAPVARTNSAVENIHMADIEPTNGLETTEGLSAYLAARMSGTANKTIRVIGGGAPGTPDRVIPPSIKEVTRIGFDGWRWLPGGPKTHAMIAAASLIIGNLHNVEPAIKDLGEEISFAWDDATDKIGDLIDDAFNREPLITAKDLPHVELKCTLEPGAVVDEEAILRLENQPGISVFSAEQVLRVQDELSRLEEAGATVTRIRMRAVASDEWITESSLGVPEAENDALSKERLAAFMNAQLEQGGIATDAELMYENTQDVLSDDELQNLSSLADQYGYDSILAAVAIFNNLETRETLPPTLRSALDIHFGENRGINIVFEYSLEGEDVEVCVPVVLPAERYPEAPKEDREDKNRDYHFNPFFLPIPPLPAFKKTYRTKVTPGKVIPGKQPKAAVTEVSDDTWVKLYPRAMKRDNIEHNNKLVLTEDAWAWTRKYQALLRDDRIEGALAYRFQDSGNVERTLRVIFVDHEPNEATIESFGELLKSLAQMRDAKVNQSLHTIAIYPEKNAGRQRNAAQVGLGLDEQYDTNTLGVAIPAVSLVELQMPTDPTKEELESITGAAWTFAHEAHGHFTDVKHFRVPISPEKGWKSRLSGSSNRYVSANPWSKTAKQLHRKLQTEDIVNRTSTWDATALHVDKTGAVHREITRERTIDGLRRAVRIRQIGSPTAYSKTNEAELYAETAAQVTTNIGLPIRGLHSREGFAETADVDERAEALFAERVGAIAHEVGFKTVLRYEEDRIKDQTEPVYTPIAGDPELLRLARAARSTPLPAESELVSILAKTRGNSVKGSSV